MSSPALALLAWYLGAQALALAALPVALRVFRRLSDRGYPFAKALGPLVVSYLAWALGLLGGLEVTPATLWGLALVVGAASWAALGPWALGELKALRRTALAWEALFAGAYLLGAGVRAFNAAIDGTEKPMDFALMNAFVTSARLPAEDPWLSGFGLAYYHFNYFQAAVLTKLTGVAPPVAYNLALVLVFALIVLLAASLVANLSARAFGGAARHPRAATASDAAERPPLGPRDVGVGLLAAFLVALAGNLYAPLEWLASRGFGDPAFWQWIDVKGLAARPPGSPFPPADGTWWFRASRIAPIQPDGINEFPYFSFLLGDLHPHFTALPLDLLVLGLGLAGTLAALFGERDRLGRALHLGVAALALGSLVAANTWDVPTFWLAYVGAALLGALLGAERPGGWLTWERLGLHLAAPPLGLALFLPYFVGYSQQQVLPRLVDAGTPLASLLVIFGPLLALTGLLGVTLARAPELAAPPTPAGATWSQAARLATVGLLGLAALLGLLGNGSAALLLALLAPFLLVAGRAVARAVPAAPAGAGAADGGDRPAPRAQRDGRPAVAVAAGRPRGAVAMAGRPAGARPAAVPAAPSPPAVSADPAALVYAGWLGLLALLVLLGVEVVFLRDSFGTRMNTVFKFHYHAWVLLGLAGAFGVAHALRSGARALAAAGALLALVALALGLVYPVVATVSVANGFRNPATLDGAQFLKASRPDDWRAIEWLAARPGRPRVLEATGNDYTLAGRIATFSGLPTLIGWVGHELQWRGPLEELGRRQAEVDRLYTIADPATIVPTLQRYGVEYVVVGSLEREKYGGQVVLRFEGILESVLKERNVAVYRVPPAAPGGRTP